MAEKPLKRLREGTQIEDEEETKRRRSYNHILSLLEADHEEEVNQDLSSLMATLQEEISYGTTSHPPPPAKQIPSEAETNNPTTAASSAASVKDDEDEQEKGAVIKDLFEASDDELGIPHKDIRVGEEEYEGIDPETGTGAGLSCWYDDRFWELDDVAANYYSFVQSELFM
ncbi:PREDICTED: uncharacterized protein LOC104602894 [Nelumbo nucifera]|uniref:Uncharacterized protein LOC104602894 n=2 Tax=Nelumbo nucifera TaxID=4432 RepID=A0A1U8AQ53_NELNU|nr:PREDICTED: uncharacterized protein LOC104602894 [Nelumbo nucifera]DAD34835.1 TPA_asm: hypothetical protein HUJ06_005475 [Nelumbo nucifera]